MGAPPGLARQKGLNLTSGACLRAGGTWRCRRSGGIRPSRPLLCAAELREDKGEIEAAGSDRLPRLVEVSDLPGALHVHTDMSDGTGGLSAIADAARQMGLSYIGVCDHSRSAYYAGGLKADDVLRQWEAIDAFNKESRDFHFFKGIESDILPDGSLDYDEELLAGFDFVVASVHSGFRMIAPRWRLASSGQWTTRTRRYWVTRRAGSSSRGTPTRWIWSASSRRRPRRRHDRAECEPLPSRYRLAASEGRKSAGRHDRH